MDGAALNLTMANHDPAAFQAAARAVGFRGFGYYPQSGFMHVNLGPTRSRGERFPVRAVPFAIETPHAREAPAESRTLRGTGAADLATVGATGVEVAAEVRGAILPPVPYLDSLRRLFIVLVPAGIAVAIRARVNDWKKGRR